MNKLAFPLLFLFAACAAAPPAGEGTVPPRVIERVNPQFPQPLRDAGLQGEVQVAGTVPKEGGRMRDIRVVGGSTDERLRLLAVQAVSQWSFEPGTRNGEPVDAEFTVTISFRLTP